MREIYSIIEKIAPTATTVVIDGETGTGKEVVAQSIHMLSPRSKGELVVFDCHVTEVVTASTHSILIGEVVEARYAPGQSLAYLERAYRHI